LSVPHIINLDKLAMLGTIIAGAVLATVIILRVASWWKNRKKV
jgi:hypothetical protein